MLFFVRHLAIFFTLFFGLGSFAAGTNEQKILDKLNSALKKPCENIVVERDFTAVFCEEDDEVIGRVMIFPFGKETVDLDLLLRVPKLPHSLKSIPEWLGVHLSEILENEDLRQSCYYSIALFDAYERALKPYREYIEAQRLVAQRKHEKKKAELLKDPSPNALSAKKVCGYVWMPPYLRDEGGPSHRVLYGPMTEAEQDEAGLEALRQYEEYREEQRREHRIKRDERPVQCSCINNALFMGALCLAIYQIPAQCSCFNNALFLGTLCLAINQIRDIWERHNY